MLSRARWSLILVLCGLLTVSAAAGAQVELPVRTLGELQRWRIDRTGETYLGGWAEYHIQYKIDSAYWTEGEEAGPFETVVVIPYTNELLWIEVRTAQGQRGDDFAARQTYNSINLYPKQLLFQVFLYGSLSVLGEEQLHFVYRDSAGSFQHLRPVHYEPIYETNTDMPTGAEIEVVADLPKDPEILDWFALHIWSEESLQGIDAGWTFRSVDPERAVHFADPALERLVRQAAELPYGELEYADVGWIKELSAAHYDISSLAGIEHLSALERLDLAYNSIRDVAPLARLTSLRILDVSHNEIESLAPLSQLHQLEELDVQGNRLRFLTGVEALTNLRSLDVSDNLIEDIAPLRGLVALRTLNLNENRIVDLTPLTDLPHLEQLNASGNRIRYIEPLADLPSLVRADVSRNDIQFLSGWLELEEAPTIIAMGNPLIDTGLSAATMEAVRGTLMEIHELGPYTLRFYDRKDDWLSSFEVWHGDTLVHARTGFSFLPVGIYGQRVTEIEPFTLGNSESTYFMIREFTGGWHCCTYIHVFQITPDLRPVDTIVGEYEHPEFVDLDGDGQFEVLVKDWTFAYWKNAFSTSPAPAVILAFDGERFRLAPEYMLRERPTPSQLETLAQDVLHDPLWAPYAEDQSGLLGPPPKLWHVMLDLIYSGHWDLAFDFLDISWPDDVPGKEQFIETFLAQLKRSRYWEEIVERIYGGRALMEAW